LSTRALAVAARKSSWGVSVMTFSGHVALHSPHGVLGIVAERAGRAGRHAGEAERAALDIDLDRAEGRAGRQRDDVDRRRRRALQLP
jgi:predicted amidohydrolase